MKKLFISLALLLSAMSFAQSGTTTRKIYIRSADPQLIALILSGKLDFGASPEPTSLSRMSSGTGFGFGGGGFGGNSGGNFGSGLGSGNGGNFGSGLGSGNGNGRNGH